MYLHRSTVLILLVLITIGCSRRQAGETAAVEKKAAEDEKTALDSVIRRIPARELCFKAFTAPSRRVNSRAALERHKKTLDSILRLDWREDEITPEQMAAWNRAKFQMNRAEVIDLAIALREDFQPPAGKRVEAAYREHGPLIERVAGEKWDVSQIGGRESKAIAKAGKALFTARQIDTAEVFARSTSTHSAAALAAHAQIVRGLAAKEWNAGALTEAEIQAVGDVLNGHLRDVAAASVGLVALGGAGPFQQAFQERSQILNRVASDPWNKDVTGDERAAVCAVLTAYKPQQ
jgi:hypothetical protein